VAWASRFLGKSIARAHTLDFFDTLLEIAIVKNISFYLLGGKEEIIRKTVDNLKKKFPALNLVGFHHGYFAKEEMIIKEINLLKPDILIVGMGIPLQEKWFYKYRETLDIHLCWAVGSVFDILSGFYKRAPQWMINSGLEWTYRLIQEPGRLWRRYLFGNLVFIYHVLKWKLRSLFLKKGSYSLPN
jgi:N-acetylglucosaminyldiphosphoundecaprenol N-acetyl-beta-D-mannosaminyltransferase